MAKDMFERMLDSFVDNIFDKMGMTKEQMNKGVQDFLGFGQYAQAAMKRIEANQILLLEAENERRRSEGRDPIGYVSNSDGTTINYRSRVDD